jgi:hypothetical protein
LNAVTNTRIVTAEEYRPVEEPAVVVDKPNELDMEDIPTTSPVIVVPEKPAFTTTYVTKSAAPRPLLAFTVTVEAILCEAVSGAGIVPVHARYIGAPPPGK